MQKSTIVTHTVDQGNLRLRITKRGKQTTKEHKEQINAGKRPRRKDLASKVKKARGFAFKKRKDVNHKKLESTICQSFVDETPLLQSKLVVFLRLKQTKAEKTKENTTN